MLIPLPDYLNPRFSRESRDRYIKYIVPLWMVSSLATTSTFYGFNVWIIPISLQMFGQDAMYSMETGQILYAFSIPTLISVLIMPLLSTEIEKIGVRLTTTIGILLYVLGLILGGVSVANDSLWGFWMSIGIIGGFGYGLVYYPVAIYSVAWFREIDRPALGSGLTGFFAGLWPAIFSFYCPLIIEYTSVSQSFYWNALIISICSIPTLLFQSSPTEVPLIVDTTLGSSNGEIVQTSSGTENRSDDDDSSATISTAGTDVEGQSPSITLTKVLPMTKSEIVSTPQFYIQFLGHFLCMLPGFVMKFNISVFSSALFQTNIQTEAIISFIFLFAYAVARLFVGLATGKLFSADIAAQLASGIQIVGFFGVAIIVITGAEYLWAYVFFEALIGIGLAVYKVTITMNALSRWSMANFPTVSALFFLAFGFAGSVGPVVGWMSLSIQGNIPLENGRTTDILGVVQKETTENIVGIFFFVMAGVAMTGFAINRYAVQVVVKNNENL